VQESTLGGSETLKRTKSCLAGEAIADSVARELAIIEGIDRGLARFARATCLRTKQPSVA
jgi:predicted transcriptional regulator